MLTLRKSDVPAYLHESAFYKALSDDVDDVEFSVPAKCFQADTAITDQSSFRNLLSTVRFWGVTPTPVSVFQVTLGLGSARHQVRNLLAEFGSDLKFLHVLDELQGSNPLFWDNVALRWGNMEVIRYLHQLDQFRLYQNSTCSTAAEHGHLECMQYFRAEGFPFESANICSKAIRGKSLHCFMYAYDDAAAENADSLFREAVGCGSVEIARFFRDKGHRLTQDYLRRLNDTVGIRTVHLAGLYDWRAHDLSTSVEFVSYWTLFHKYRLGSPFTLKVYNRIIEESGTTQRQRDCIVVFIALYIVSFVYLCLFEPAWALVWAAGSFLVGYFWMVNREITARSRQHDIAFDSLIRACAALN